MPEKKNFVLRLDQGAYKALEKWAADEFRSVNGQIEYILNQALKEQFGPHFQEKFTKNSKDAVRPRSPGDTDPPANQ
ncbi:hypothetical protein SAMN05192529_10821 [Arachidicoccus rhizosphaerae]|uniref:Arc-like DNA binding domain-containing protein n=1 Tax=Arachidicoccus rhizosphaerae TaxID=551991 RepID=A0A1H3YDU6_9BACT|nr:hypothetical protein [Arachidicoccus rhizosphaerae]SEA09673.1 hypothetical protein SAMN05192529_10821 [Arachidicoccus rhizosphaerae]